MCRMAFFPSTSTRLLTFLCLKILRMQLDFLEEDSVGEQDLICCIMFASGKSHYNLKGHKVRCRFLLGLSLSRGENIKQSEPGVYHSMQEGQNVTTSLYPSFYNGGTNLSALLCEYSFVASLPTISLNLIGRFQMCLWLHFFKLNVLG